MINEAIELVSRGEIMLTDFSSGTIRPEVMAQRPSAYLQFSRAPMTVKSSRREEPASHWLHETINHIAGAISLGVIEGQNKTLSFSSKFFHSL